MRYLGFVITNYGDDLPLLGAVKVVCPQVWGFEAGTKGTGNFLEDIKKGKVSPVWIYPTSIGSNDSVIPDVGDYVLFDYIESINLWVWTGFLLKANTNYNPFIKNPKSGKYDLPMPSVDINTKLETTHKTRVVGTKCGSAIIFEDTWIKEKNNQEKRSSKAKIVVGGKSHLYDDREGLELIFDASEEKEKIEIIVQDKTGNKRQSILIDNTKDAGFIEIIDNKNQHIYIDTENEEIGVEDVTGNIIKLNEDGIEVKAEGKLNITASDNIEVDAGSNNITVKGNEVNVESTKLNITCDSDIVIKNNTQKIEMGSASTKITGVAGSVEVM